MTTIIEVKVPDIGDYKNVPVIEVLVTVGDKVKAEDALITLESDKATMDVPSPVAGTIANLKVKVGDKVSEGSLILTLSTDVEAAASEASPARGAAATAAVAAPTAASYAGGADIECELLVLGAGPGGYSAAFRAADLGKKTVLIERYATLGGVCLNVGCIPSKALLHTAAVMDEAKELSGHGITYAAPQIDIGKLRGFKEGVIKKLTVGLAGMAKARRVEVVRGVGRFLDPHCVEVELTTGGGQDKTGEKKTIRFQQAIIAAGSQAVKLPFMPDDPRVVDSTGALELASIPERMLVIGGGIIGLEMATVYDALGSKISVVELMDQLMPGADKDMVKPLHNRVAKRYEAIMLKTKVTKIEATKAGLKVTFEGEQAPAEAQVYDKVLMAVGRRPNGREIAAEAAGLIVNERGFIPVDKQQRTNVPHIFAIGDIVGDPMLAHKAVHEGKVAAENIAGHKAFFEPMTIPSVAYTDPEVAWMGLTETQAKAQNIEYEKASFPWAASGRALSIAREEGSTKVLLDPKSRRILGMGIVGVNAGELIAEGVLALEMGADMEDIGLTIHPHPTLSETLCFAAEMAEGTITDLIAPKKK
jgi:dihydrolipoamide dehydrogenase